MKKILLFASALAGLFLAASCQQENLEPVQMGNTVTITVEAPGAMSTKAIADGLNVNEVHYAVYKTAEGVDYSIYNEGNNETDGPLAQGVVEMEKKRASIDFDLLQDQEYTVIFWAQVKDAGHYNLGDLRTISFANNTVVGNDESRAAFYAKYSFDTKVHKDHKVTLFRPFAQLNLLTTEESLHPDQPGQTIGYDIEILNSKVIVTGLSNVFNTVTGVSEDATTEFTFDMAKTPAQNGETTLEVNGVNYHYVSMNYFFVPLNEKLVDITYYLDTDKGSIDNEVVSVPVKKNHRTNVIGNLLTRETSFEIIVDERFEQPDELADIAVTTPTDADALAAAIANPDIKVINLACDINGSNFRINENDPAKELTMNMNDYAISNGSEDGSYDFYILNKSTVIFNDANFPEAGGMIQAAYGATVIFNSGVSNILSTSTSQRYNFYAASPGTTITINDGTFTFDAYRQRSYACAVNGAIIYIKGGTFGVAPNHTRWTTPIYTDATGKVIITGGTFGFDPTEWLAPGYEAIKSGNTWTVKYVAATADALAAGFANPDVNEINVTAPISATSVLSLTEDKALTLNMNNNAFSTGSADSSYDINVLAGSLTLNDANFPEAGGMIQAAYGAEVVFNSGVSTIATGTTSQRYNFYAASPGTTITINGGSFAFEAYKKRSYVCALNSAVVYITGGTFGPAPTHPNWKHPIYTESNGQVIITGGSFGFDPTEWVAEGYQAVQSGSTWTVEAL